jgi:hypothetical protein
MLDSSILRDQMTLRRLRLTAGLIMLCTRLGRTPTRLCGEPVGRNPPGFVFCIVIDLSQCRSIIIECVLPNCGGHIHAVFICNARLFCGG